MRYRIVKERIFLFSTNFIQVKDHEEISMLCGNLGYTTKLQSFQCRTIQPVALL